MSDSLEAHLLDQVDGATGFFWHRLRWRFVEANLPEGPFTLLDVGAGSGVTGEFLSRARPDAEYVFDEPIESLRTRLRARYGSDHDLHQAAGILAVDVVVLLDVLEHVDDDRAFLDGLVARLAPGTVVVVTVPASMRLWSEWDVVLGHRRRYEPSTLAALVSSVPVEVVETGHLFAEMLPAALWRARSRPAARSGDDAGPRASTARDARSDVVSEFPRLPRLVNSALYYVGLPAVRFRRWARVGTSLCAVLRVRGTGASAFPGSQGASRSS